MKKRIQSLDEYINENKINETVTDISDWDMTDTKYEKWAKKLKVGDVFLQTHDGVDVSVIKKKDFKKGKEPYETEDLWIGHDYKGADVDKCKVVATDIKVKIDLGVDEYTTNAYLYEVLGEHDEYYFVGQYEF